MKKLLISTKVVENPNYIEVSNIIAYEYIEFFEKLGYMVILIPNNSANVLDYFKIQGIEGVVLIGGNNVDPSLYKSTDKLSDVYPERDKTEELLLREANRLNIPLLGICRGFHFINVSFGGTITHGIKDHVRKPHKLISEHKVLSDVVTNTFHNQGLKLDDISKELNVIATTSDGFVEAFIHKTLPVLGVQWHPERQNESFDNILIKNFLKDKQI
ncbi:MAG: gamma-glutamyl-gamma-aminobutyrate hydrolase family protein [Spirochaetaceae bacterium]